jgi:archaeal chaperonin
LITGPTNTSIEEYSRGITDSLLVMERLMKSPYIVIGGGAIEMSICNDLRKEDSMDLVEKYVIECIENIPRILIKNFGMDMNLMLNKFRKENVENWAYGLNYDEFDVVNNFEKGVLEIRENKIALFVMLFQIVVQILKIEKNILI